MTTEKSLVPQGISHDIDLSKMNYNDRMKHHTKQLRTILFLHGIEGARAYKEKYPEAKSIWIDIKTNASQPKPKGYAAALLNIVDGWLQSDTALTATNRADVERLNSKLETDRFNPSTHFSKPLSPPIRNKIAAIMEAHGARLPASAESMSAVRKAIQAFKANGQSEAQPFAAIGSRTGDSITLGNRKFRIEDYRGRACIRVTTGGVTQRLYLETIEALLSGFSESQPGDNLSSSIVYTIGELVSAPKSDAVTVNLDNPETSSPGDIDLPTPADEPAPSLYDRIARLAANNRAAPIMPADNGRDILEL